MLEARSLSGINPLIEGENSIDSSSFAPKARSLHPKMTLFKNSKSTQKRMTGQIVEINSLNKKAIKELKANQYHIAESHLLTAEMMVKNFKKFWYMHR